MEDSISPQLGFSDFALWWMDSQSCACYKLYDNATSGVQQSTLKLCAVSHYNTLTSTGIRPNFLRDREHDIQVVMMRSLPVYAEVLFVLVTFPTSWIETTSFGFSPRMLNQLVAIEILLVVKVMSAKDAVEAFEGRGWHCVCGGKCLRMIWKD